MSQERRERRQERTQAPKPRNWGRVAVYAVLIAAAFAVAWYLGQRSQRKTQHKYDALAQCLSARGLKMYGAWWCPHCQEQKEEFLAAYKYLPYIECGVKGDVKARNPECVDAGIKVFPTWQFPPTGERHEGTMSLRELSDKSGCPLP